MIATSLKLVLLVAVAAAQMAGGGTCCCLWRSLGTVVLAQFSAEDEVRDHGGEPSVGCPSCSKARQGKETHCPSSSEAALVGQQDQECQCVKSSVSSHAEGRELTAICFFDFAIVSLVRIVAVDAPRVRVSCEKASVVCGRSWHALACVWRI